MTGAKRRRSGARLAVALPLVALLAAACGGSSSSGNTASTGGTPASSGASSQGAAPLTKVTLSYSQKVGDEIPVWTAAEAGIFKQNGLDVTLKYITGKNGVPALLSGQTDVAALGGSETLAAAAGGAKLKYVLTLVPTYTFELWAQPQYATAAALKGQRLGVTSSSGSQYIGTVLSLKELGLTPQDVQIVPLGSVPNVNSALIAKSVAAVASHPPATYEMKKAGLKLVVSLPDKNIPAAISGFAVTQDYAAAHGDVVQKLAKSIIQAIQKDKSDKAFAEQMMKKYMDVTDQGSADATYDFYVTKVIKTVPAPTLDQFTASVKSLEKKNPAVKSFDLSGFVDDSYVTKAAKELGVSAG